MSADESASAIHFAILDRPRPSGGTQGITGGLQRGAIGLTQQMGAGTQKRCTMARPFCHAHGSRATRLRGSSGHCGHRRPLDRHDSGSNTFNHLMGCDRNTRHALERIRAKLVPNGLHVSR